MSLYSLIISKNRPSLHDASRNKRKSIRNYFLTICQQIISTTELHHYLTCICSCRPEHHWVRSLKDSLKENLEMEERLKKKKKVKKGNFKKNLLVLGLSTDIVFTTWNTDVGKTNKQTKAYCLFTFLYWQMKAQREKSSSQTRKRE